MSKPIAEVLKASRPLHERILDFLRAAPEGQAYTFPEIYAEVEGVDPRLRELVTLMWDAATREGKTLGPPWAPEIDKLVASGAVRKASTHGTDYFWVDRGGEP